APVTYEARSDRRETTTEAIWPGSASRLSGRPAPALASTSSRSTCWAAKPSAAVHASVAVGPGVTALQRMPSLAYTSATRRENESIPAFITEYSGSVADGRFPDVDATLTIAPPLPMRGSAARVVRIALIKLRSN